MIKLKQLILSRVLGAYNGEKNKTKNIYPDSEYRVSLKLTKSYLLNLYLVGLILYRSIQRPLHGNYETETSFFTSAQPQWKSWASLRDRLGENIRKIPACRKSSNNNAEKTLLNEYFQHSRLHRQLSKMPNVILSLPSTHSKHSLVHILH